MELRGLFERTMTFVSSSVPHSLDGQFHLTSCPGSWRVLSCHLSSLYESGNFHIYSAKGAVWWNTREVPQIRGHSSHIPPVPPTQKTMDQHIHSLAEAMLATTVGNGRNSLMLPIVDILDEVRPRSPGRAQWTHHRASRCRHPRPQTHL